MMLSWRAEDLLKLVSLGYRVGVMDMSREGNPRFGRDSSPRSRSSRARVNLVVRDNLELPDGHVWLTDDSRQNGPRFAYTGRG
jgi:hypothetical protein